MCPCISSKIYWRDKSLQGKCFYAVPASYMYLQIHVAHHIAGNFCRLLGGARQKMPHPQILQSKLPQIATKPQSCLTQKFPAIQQMNAEAPYMYMYSVCDIVNDSHIIGYATIYLDSSSFTKTLNWRYWHHLHVHCMFTHVWRGSTNHISLGLYCTCMFYMQTYRCMMYDVRVDI